MNRDSFVIYAEWDDAIRKAPDDIQIECYHALMDYAKTGIMPNGLSWSAEMFMTSIQSRLDAIIDRYQASVENGKKGGNPNFRKGKSNPYYAKNTKEMTAESEGTSSDGLSSDLDEAEDVEAAEISAIHQHEANAPSEADEDVSSMIKMMWKNAQEKAKKSAFSTPQQHKAKENSSEANKTSSNAQSEAKIVQNESVRAEKISKFAPNEAVEAENSGEEKIDLYTMMDVVLKEIDMRAKRSSLFNIEQQKAEDVKKAQIKAKKSEKDSKNSQLKAKEIANIAQNEVSGEKNSGKANKNSENSKINAVTAKKSSVSEENSDIKKERSNSKSGSSTQNSNSSTQSSSKNSDSSTEKDNSQKDNSNITEDNPNITDLQAGDNLHENEYEHENEYVNVFSQLRNQKNNCDVRVRASTEGERTFWTSHFSDFWKFCAFTEERQQLGWEVIDTLIEALKQAGSEEGLTFNRKRYDHQSLFNLFASLDGEDLSKVVWSLSTAEGVKSRPFYILGALVQKAGGKG